jgi:hypothetical protein
MASNEYKLSVVDGTELTLIVNAGLQGPAGPSTTLSGLSDVNISGRADSSILRWDSSTEEWVTDFQVTDRWIIGSEAIIRPSASGWVQTPSLRIFNINNPNLPYAQLNSSPTATSNTSFTLPATSGTIATNNSAVMLTGNQTAIAGNKSFDGQMELTGQALTNGTSAVTRDLGDARYGATYVGIKNDNVPSVSNTPIKLTSVTLPIGTYQIDSNIAATAPAPNGGFLFGLKSNNPIKISLFETYGTDGGTTTNNVAASDNTTLTQRSIAAGSTLTNKRQLVGLLEVITNNTEVSLEFSQDTTTPAVASTTRKRAYIIARKIA